MPTSTSDCRGRWRRGQERFVACVGIEKMSIRCTTLHYHSAHVTHSSIEIVHLWKETVQVHGVLLETVKARTTLARTIGRFVGMVVVRAPHRRRAFHV